jgi:AcrR family transcriptional regulator
MKRAQRSRGHHHGDLRRALIIAAGDMLERDGPESISFRAIARAAGVSQTAPYNHFHSKEDLLATVAEGGFRELETSQLAAAKTDGQRITALGLDYVGFATARPQLYRLMFGVGVSGWCGHPTVGAAKHASFIPVQEALATHLGIDAGSNSRILEIAAISAWALVHGLSMLLIDRSLDPVDETSSNADTLIERVLTMFVAGLGVAAAKADEKA